MSSAAPTEPAPTTSPTATPTQRRVAAQLFGRVSERPTFHPGIADELRRALERGLSPLVTDRGARPPLVLTKRVLANVQTCPGLAVAGEAERFAWTAATARGTVAHKAIELSLTLHDNPPPLDLVDLAVDRLIDSDRGIRTWLLDAPAAEVAELRGAAADWVVKFQDSFPALKRAWRPRLESGLTVDLCGHRVVLRGKVDLALGRADGTTARVLIVDFKTGLTRPVHAEDLRFYALLETLRVGVPPYRLATFSLDSGSWAAEDVTPGILRAAVRRTIEGATTVVALEQGGPPDLRPSSACQWCPAAPECPAAAATRSSAVERAVERPVSLADLTKTMPPARTRAEPARRVNAAVRRVDWAAETAQAS